MKGDPMKTRSAAGTLVMLLGWYSAASAEPPANDDKVAALVKTLKGKDDPARLAAVKSLADLGGHARAAVPALVDLLKSGSEDLRLNSTLALGRIGKPAAAAVGEVLQHKDPDARYY